MALAANSPSLAASVTNSTASGNLVRLSTSSSSFSFILRTPSERSTIVRRMHHLFKPACSMTVESPSTGSLSSSIDRKEATSLHFAKYHGIGNDFVLVDNRDSLVPKITSDEAVKLCDRHYGIGADGLILVLPGINGTDYTMKIFNPDGSEPEMCGNGMRCFAKFIAQLNKLNGRQRFTVHTGAGLIVPEVQEDGTVRVDMGEPIFKPYQIPTKMLGRKSESVVGSLLNVDGYTWNVTLVSMGNPHCVTFGNIDRQGLVVDELDLSALGPKFERHRMFPARINTEFVQVFSATHVKARVWERGAGATLACGTGACAVVVAGVLEGHCGRICTVDLPGGSLKVEWSKSDNHVYLTGPADAVFFGSLEYAALHSETSSSA